MEVYFLFKICLRYGISSYVNKVSYIFFRYNNKTYTVDDIAWDKHPTDTFEKPDGQRITYKEYYATAYENSPKDDKQPLLLSRPKDKDRKRGVSGNIYLLPEFCSITGEFLITIL